MKSAGIPKWGQTDRRLVQTYSWEFQAPDHEDSNGWIWFGFGFVFKLPDPKINKICASKTENAALLKYIWKNLKTSLSSCSNQFSWRETEINSLCTYFIMYIIPSYHLEVFSSSLTL